MCGIQRISHLYVMLWNGYLGECACFFQFDIFNNHDTGFKDTSFLANLLTYLHEKEQFNYALGARTKLCVAPRHVTTYYRSNTINPVLSARR